MKIILWHSTASILFALLALSCVHSKPSSKMDYRNPSLEKSLEEAFHESGLKSVSMGFVTSQGEIFTAGFGAIGLERNVLGDKNSIFRIASMTKAITSVAVLQLAEKGLLNLDDNAGDYMPEIDLVPVLGIDGSFSKQQNRTTIKQLLTHTSGFSYNIFDERLKAFDIPANWTHRDSPKVFEAGEGWVYGTGIDWAGRIVEVVSGQSLEQYFRDNISGPLEMNHTWFNVPDEKQGLIVSLFRRQDDGTIVEVPRRPSPKVSDYNGGGGLFSSVNDYLRFLQMILNKGTQNGIRILGKEWVDLLFADLLPELLHPETLPKFMGHSPAWAIQLNDNDFGRRAGSAYWSGYLNTFYSIDRNTGIATVVMTNFMPFLDPAPLRIYKLFESLVRKSD